MIQKGEIEAMYCSECGISTHHVFDGCTYCITKKERTMKEWKKEEAHVSENGSLRYNKGKAPMHLVPPKAIKALADVLSYGATKYTDRNWESGANYSVPYASLMRHLLAFWEGEDNDPESGLPHSYHVLMNAAMLVEYETMEGLDDRPKEKK